MFKSDRAPSRTALLMPFAVLIIVAVLHAVYWTLAASQIEQRALAWIESQEAAGYQVGYDSLHVNGYPFRFSLRAEAPRLTAPDADGGWTASVERLAASAQFYDLNHWIVAPAGVGEIVSAGETYQLTADAARLSLRARNGATARIGASIENLTITAQDGQAPAVRAVKSLALASFLNQEDQLALRLQIDGLALGEGELEPALVQAFGSEASLLRMDALVTQWVALARLADPAEWRQAGGALVVNQAQLIWGPAELSGAGEIGLDADLLPEGRLSVVVTDPETLIGGLEAAGLVHDEQGEALRLAALMAPRREGGIALPFRLREGGIFLGPARVGSLVEPEAAES